MEVRYTILNDSKDVHFSLKLDHKINYSNTQFSDIHLILRIKSNTFSWLQVDDDAGRYLLTTEQQKNCQVIGPKETCKVKTGEDIHKDDWTIDELKHGVHGFASKNGLGCWFVTPLME